MQQRFMALVAVVMAVGSFACAQPEALPAPGVELLTIDVDGRSYPYAVYRSPHLKPDEPAPMVVFLHGYGECGTDGTKQLAVGLMPAIMLNNERWPAVVLLPQKPDGESQWEDHTDAVLAMMDAVVRTHNVDPQRIALTGLSQGGHGSFVIGARYPERFCAVAPVCGYVGWHEYEPDQARWPPNWVTDSEDPQVQELAVGLAGLPVWAFHGDKDNVVPMSQTQLAVDAIKQDNASAKLTVLEGVWHDAWIKAYADPELAAWLLKDRSAE